MSVIDGFANDLFLSYAHADNEPGTAGRRWVTDFHDHLSAALRQRIGARSGELSIFFDPALRANQSLEDLLGEVRGSALLLVVGSPSWIASDFCQRELEAFFGPGAAPNNCFVIEPVPLHSTHRYPGQIEQHIRVQFHVADPEIAGLRLPLTAVDQREHYQRLLLKVAYEIADKLIELRSFDSAINTKLKPGHGELTTPKTVLLADATDDLEQASSFLASSLRQFGITVVEGADRRTYGTDLATAFRHRLRACDLCVQLIGRYAGKRADDHPHGLVSGQAELASVSGIPFLQWRSPELQPDEVAPEILPLLDGKTVICSNLSDFIQEILMRLAPTAPPVERAAESFVFIDADQADSALAKSLASELGLHDITSILPTNSDDPATRLSDLEDNLLDCHGLVLVYGTSQPTWIRSQLRQVVKLQSRRQSPLRPLLLLESPPQPKSEIGVVMPNLGRESISGEGDIASVVQRMVGDMRK